MTAEPPLSYSIDQLMHNLGQSGEDLVTQFDADWPSTCEQGTHWVDEQGELKIRWKPQRRGEPYTDFSHFEDALGFPLHPDVKEHYGRYWSANVEAQAPDGDLTLLYLWNREDVDRLIENLIGHSVACRNNKTPFAVFFAVTEPDSDYYLTVNNETGAVQLETPAKKPIKTVAASLSEFMASLTLG